MHHNGVYYEIKNNTPLRTRMFQNVMNECLDRLTIPAEKEIIVEIDEVSYEAAMASATADGTYASLQEYFLVEGKFSFQGKAWVKDGDENEYHILLVWVPDSEPGINLNEVRQVNHGGIIYETGSFGEALRFCLAHEIRHCWQFAQGLGQQPGPSDEVDADEFARQIVEG